jgi:Na+-transporting NADH:ubiquinone oxidoreductase subunit D
MSSEVQSTTAAVEEKKKSEPLFSKKNIQVLKDPLNDNNPVTVQVLGICSALAVTTQVKPSLIMALSVIFVAGFSNLIISMIRNTVPNRIRIIVQLVVIAALVTLVDQTLKAFVYDVSKALSVFVGLIITNCLIMGRLEAFAMQKKPWPSFLDGIGSGAGYGLVLLFVGVFRELFGSGSLMGYQIVPQWAYDLGYVNNGLMMLPPAALFLIGVYIWIQRALNKELVNVS